VTPCVLRCLNAGTSACGVCRIPDGRGRALCPECRTVLCYEQYDEEKQRAAWACTRVSGGCGARVWVPVGDLAGLARSREAAVGRRKRARAAAARERRCLGNPASPLGT